jgi:hypothetical protein
LSNVVEDVVRVDFSETVVVMDLDGPMSLPCEFNAGGVLIVAMFSELGNTEDSIPMAVGFDAAEAVTRAI